MTRHLHRVLPAFVGVIAVLLFAHTARGVNEEPSFSDALKPLLLTEIGATAPVRPSPKPQWKLTGHFSYILGYKRLEGAWSPAQDQVQVGVFDLDLQLKPIPFSFAAQFLTSYSGNTPSSLPGDYCGTYELNLGLRKIFEIHPAFQPYVGGGFSIIGASTTSQITDDMYYQDESDFGIGWWVGAGFYWNIDRNWHLGAGVQYSSADIDLGHRQFNAGGFEPFILLGVHF